MDLECVREALRHRPFRPFSIRLADERALPVTHPEMVAVGSRRIIVVLPDDLWRVIEPLLIVSLDYEGKNRSSAKARKRNKL